MNQTLKRVLGEDTEGSEEKREVQLAREILAALQELTTGRFVPVQAAHRISDAANELITMHTQASGQGLPPANTQQQP